MSADDQIAELQEALRNAGEEIEQQRRHFRTETQNYERYERIARREIEQLKLEKRQLINKLNKAETKLSRARELAYALSRI